MSGNRTLRILLTILTVAVVATAGWFLLQQILDQHAAKSAPAEAERLLYSTNLSEEDQVRLKELQRKVDIQVERQLLRTPVLAIEVRPIPKEQNGYYQLIQWLEAKPAVPREIPAAIENMHDKSGSWDEAAVKTWLAETEATREDLHRIGSLRECSAYDVPITQGLRTVQQHSAEFRYAIELLLTEAEAYLNTGDHQAAFTSTRAAAGLIYHLDHHEHVTMMHETISLLTRSLLNEKLTSVFLPKLVTDKLPLDNWTALLRAMNRNFVQLNRLARGEWHTIMHTTLVPQLYATKRSYIPDPDYVIDVWTDRFCQAIAVREPSFALKPRPVPEMSKNARKFTEAALDDDMESWVKGYDRIYISSTLAEAAFTLAQQEALGKAASDPATIALLPPDPSTGNPFVFDPATRALSTPTPDITPITIPARP